MIKNIFIEKSVLNDPYTKSITSHFEHISPTVIDKIDDVFQKVKKPYLHKRTDLNIFIGKKYGQRVKKAPPAYGMPNEPHYYFIHSYNCIYECQYCYLQGYFHSPDLVFFVNHDEIILEMSNTLKKHKGTQRVWFHAGEFSDSLALSHITNEFQPYFEFFKQHKNAYLELRSKSCHIKSLKKLKPLPNTVVSFSLSPRKIARDFEKKVPPTSLRIKVMKELYEIGYPLAVHLDPIIYNEAVVENYKELIDDLASSVPLEKIQYYSLGVVRFTKNVFYQFQKNYPESSLVDSEWVQSIDGKVKYSRPVRSWILKEIKNLLIQEGVESDKIYLSME